MTRTVLTILLFGAVSFAQKPLLFQPCIMCEILDDDSSSKVLEFFAEYKGKEYAFDTDAHREAFLRDPEVWLTWNDELAPVGRATLVPS